MQISKMTVVSVAIIASAAAILGTVTTANAGPETAPKNGAKKMSGKRMGGGKMIKELNLTASQQTRIKTIQADAMTKRKAISTSTTLTEEQKKSQMRTLMMSTMTRMQDVLTPEQKKTLQKKMQEQMGSMRKMQSEKGAAPAPRA